MASSRHMRIARLGLIGVAAVAAACGDAKPTPTPNPDGKVPPKYRVGGAVAGLKGQGLTLQNRGADTLAVAADGPFSFATEAEEGTDFAVTVASQPTNPRQTCTVQDGSGKVPAAAVTGVKVSCATNTYGVGGTIAGIASGEVTLQLNGAQTLTQGNGGFTFPTKLEDAASYTVTVASAPEEHDCTVGSGAGKVDGADVGFVQVTCFQRTYTVGGTVEGLTGTLGLRLNGGEILSLTADGRFTFRTRLTKGSAYTVAVTGAQPQGQRCVVSEGTGTVDGAVEGIAVRCHPFVAFDTFPAASRVLGQSDFEASAPNRGGNAVNAGTLDGPWGNPVLAGGKLYVSDLASNRILGFDGIPATDGAGATFALGQSRLSNAVSASGRAGLASPSGISSDGTRLAVADKSNSRVILHAALPTTTGAEATTVIGQPDFATTDNACDDRSLAFPEDVFVGHGKLLVADSANNRVLIWNTLPTGNEAPADLVLGQQSFTQCASNDVDGNGTSESAPAASTLNNPTGVWTDGTRLVVADNFNNRVLIWNQFPTTRGQAADVVLGQSSFTTMAAATSPTGLSKPYFVNSTGLQLFVADHQNNRVLVWNQFPTQSGAAADFALGQPDLNSKHQFDPPASGTPTARSLYQPGGMLLAWPNVVVTDYGNNRVLVFQSK